MSLKDYFTFWLSRICFVHALYLCICYCWTSNTAEVLRPRGVSLSKKSFYEPSKDFSCLDGSASIPFYFVNDDYCDCADGSDEPGTAACPNGHFYCINSGYISVDIPSSRVNDGICDCCDGSDEYNSTAECGNMCLELGKQAQEEARKQRELYEKGYSMWKEYSLKGKQIKEDNKLKLQNLQASEEDAEKLKTAKEAIKNEAESKEKAALSKYEAFKEAEKREVEESEMIKHEEDEKQKATQAFEELDVNADGVLSVYEIQQFDMFDNNRDGTVTAEEAKFFLHMKESMQLEEFITTGWMIMKPIFKLPLASTPEEDDGGIYDQEEDLLDEEDEEGVDEDNAQIANGDAPTKETLPPPPLPAEQTDSKKNEIQYDEETQNLIDEANKARTEYKEAADSLEAIKNDIKQTQADIECDFGQEEEFAVLKGQCFDFDDREYTYRFCPFDRASQIPKSGGSEISLGHWGHWAGPDDNKYSKIKMENGQACWNGPSRSAMILLDCGLENKILSTSEPNRCEYLFEFSSPAFCFPTQDVHGIHEHTEL